MEYPKMTFKRENAGVRCYLISPAGVRISVIGHCEEVAKAKARKVVRHWHATSQKVKKEIVSSFYDDVINGTSTALKFLYKLEDEVNK